jgi:hypothetical protein
VNAPRPLGIPSLPAGLFDAADYAVYWPSSWSAHHRLCRRRGGSVPLGRVLRALRDELATGPAQERLRPRWRLCWRDDHGRRGSLCLRASRHSQGSPLFHLPVLGDAWWGSGITGGHPAPSSSIWMSVSSFRPTPRPPRPAGVCDSEIFQNRISSCILIMPHRHRLASEAAGPDSGGHGYRY